MSAGGEVDKVDPVTMIAAAVAAGAAAGTGDTAKQVVRDAYTALRASIVRRYGVVEDRIADVEFDPPEPARRRLLAEQLVRSGAGADQQVRAAAAELLRVIAEQAPEAAATVGVALIRTEAGGDIEVTDVAVGAGTAVVATDVTAGGSIRISGVRVGSPGKDPFDALG